MSKKIIVGLIISVVFLLSGLPVFAASEQIEDEIIYQIIVDRFNNGNYEIDDDIDVENPKAFHGGDLEGITAKLDDLATLGVTTLSLSPIMNNAADGFHGYWIEDFTEMEENFGSMEALDELVEEAHNRGMKVVLEFVTNYVSDTHDIALDPTKNDWILTSEVEGPDWTEGVVQLDQDHPEVQELLLDAASFWLGETDIDGLTLHAVDESSVSFLAAFTETLKSEYESIYLFGDVLHTSENMEEILNETALDAMDNYLLGETISEVFRAPDQPVEVIYEASQEAMEQASIVAVDNKYSKRFTQQFAENGRNALTTWKLALTYLYTTPGTPAILQGSEVEMYGEDAEDSQRLVPFLSGSPELIEFHDRLSSLRNEFPALRRGDFEMVDANDSMLVYKRSYEGQTMYVAINNGSESNYADVSDIGEDQMLRGYLEDNLARVNEEGNHRIGIPRESAEVYEVVEAQGFNWGFIAIPAGVMIIFVAGIILLTVRQKRQEAAENNK
jgi:glycosidase